MPVQYTNRMGQTFYLCQGTTKTGKPRYFFAREPRDSLMEEMPEGYEVKETVNGLVSAAKVRESPLQPKEVEIVADAVAAHPQAKEYRVEAKGKMITVYESAKPGLGAFLKSMSDRYGVGQGAVDQIEESSLRRGRFSPVMRFTLSDPVQRLFRAERMRYSGMTHWISVDYEKPIDELATPLIQTLGTDAFFELY